MNTPKSQNPEGKVVAYIDPEYPGNGGLYGKVTSPVTTYPMQDWIPLISATTLADMKADVADARRTAQYWKDCHLAGSQTIDDMQRRLEAVTELYGRLCGQVDDSKADFGWKIIRSYRDELRGILFDEPPVLRGDGKGDGVSTAEGEG